MVYSDLRATPGEARVRVTDLPGLCIVRVQRDGSDDASAPLRVLRFQRFDTSDPHQIQCLADVSAQPGLLTINCGWEGLNGTRSVQLLQHVPVIPNPQRPPLPQIDLFVQGFDDSGQGQRTADLRLTAPD
jgi:hypothetical protein